MEIRCKKHSGKRWTKGQREQGLDQQKQIQPLHFEIRGLPHMPPEGAPSWIPLLSVVRIQKSHLRYVRQEAHGYKELQTVGYIILPSIRLGRVMDCGSELSNE